MKNDAFGRTKLLAVLPVLALLAAILIGVRPANATTFTVNTTQDGGDMSWADGVCDTGALTFPGTPPQCSLRAAIQQANYLAGADTVGFSVGSVTLTNAGRSEDLAATGDLDIRQDVTIEGDGVTVTEEGSYSDRIFHVLAPANTTIKDVTIERGEEIDGGGIYVAQGAKLDLIGSTVKNNLAKDPAPNGEILGGGIYSAGALKMVGSTISDNTAEAPGGGESYGAGLFVNGGPATISDSTISGNQSVSTNAPSAGSYGGGVYNQSSGLTMTNVTVSDNGSFGAASVGGGIYDSQTLLTLTNATVNGNSAAYGANLYRSIPGSGSIKNTIVANPQGGASCSGVTSSGNNLSSDGSCNFTAAGDIQNQDPKLGPLQINGGPTRTHALLSGSPAIDAGTNAGCLGTDQRNVSRPQDGNTDGSATCDIGAFEVDPPPDTQIISGPAGVVSYTSAAFEFTSTEPGSSFECALKRGAINELFAPCSSPKTYSSLGDGSHTFRVRAIDAAGNIDPTPALRTWTVDTTGPSITALQPAPDARILDRTPLIAATVTDGQAELASTDMALYVDGLKVGSFAYDPSTDRLTCTSGRLSYGVHTAKVTAHDRAGNMSAKSWSFKVIR